MTKPLRRWRKGDGLPPGQKFSKTFFEMVKDTTYYDLLGVKPYATEKELRTAFRKKALKYHPDHNESETATDEFRTLCEVHQVLSDPQRRKIYDETGEAEEADPQESQDSYEYWRNVFPKITKQDIDEYRKKYIGSAEEVEDIIEAVQKSKGDMAITMAHIPFASSSEVPRLLGKIKELFQSGQLPKKYHKTYKETKGAVQATMECEEAGEAKEAEEAAKEILGEEAQTLDSEAGLRAIIARRQETRNKDLDSYTSYLEAKYAKKAKKQNAKYAKKAKKQNAQDGPLPSEEEFQNIQRSFSGKKNTKNKREDAQGSGKKKKKTKGKQAAG
eukprot:g27297.t1